MRLLGVILALTAWLLASTGDSMGQTQDGYVLPECPGVCYFANLEPILTLQTS
jgi:hypothetical protein